MSHVMGALLMSIAWLANAQESSPRAAIETKLAAEYPPTEVAADKKSIVTPGAVLVLEKDNLLMVDAGSANPSQNVYKDGKISRSLASKVHIPNSGSRAFRAGEKLWATRIDVTDSGVVFELLTMRYPDGNARYRALLTFPFAKGAMPSADRVADTIGEVLKVRPGTAAKSVAPAASEPAATENPLPPIAIPPPVTEDAPSKPIGLGSTVDQVVAAYGKPLEIAKAGNGEIYSYKNLKVTFVDGKVTDIE
jgi:hypothetical protein